jgi:magnesium-protoporphyrin IX monomethyl ester (oxidative) cyclase
MKVLLADPPAKGTKIDDSYPNLGALYLAGSLKNCFGEREVTVDYLGPKHDLGSHLAAVQKFSPDVYGISFTSKAAGRSYETIKAVKEARPDAWIVAGGPHPTAMPEDIFHQSPVDVVGLSECEVTFAELVKAIYGRRKPEFESVEGIAFRDNGDIVQTGPRPFIKNIDDIPFPAWEMVDFREYPGMHLKKQPIESSLLVSRGCPFHCAFCSQPIWKAQKPWLRARSVENVCEEIKVLYERGVREIYLSADELNFNQEWAVGVCQGIKDLNLSDLYFQCNMRADKVSRELVEALASINCWLIHLGIESANDRVLEGIGKHVTVAQIENAARLLSRAGIKVFAFMMLYQAWEDDGELQFETTEEVENSLRWARKMFRERSIHYMSWQFCTPMPGARLYEIAKRHNLYRGDPRDVWASFDEHNACMNLPGIPPRTMSWKLKKGILVKDWFMLRSGGISTRHVWRAWENFLALCK